ncbi:MAG TPA: LemA family protein [Candidatus Saccharimonadales bacterium]|nr:LemA family protein [Candidatus Saccharimonadales bacterium]HSW91225.1 LemA family protein [Candidatus Saccharimonadales bacterium]
MSGLVIAVIVIVVLAIIAAIIAGMYNGLVRLNVKAQEAWSGITVQLKRRADLIPNLVESVKGYAAHESGVFEKVTEARSAIMNATQVGPAAAAQAEGELTGALKSLFAVAENYPDLKASQNFMDLQAQIADTEDKVAASRRFYNSTVTLFNTKRKVFPTNIFANMLGFTQDKEFFDVPEGERQAVEQAPEVKF